MRHYQTAPPFLNDSIIIQTLHQFQGNFSNEHQIINIPMFYSNIPRWVALNGLIGRNSPASLYCAPCSKVAIGLAPYFSLAG